MSDLPFWLGEKLEYFLRLEDSGRTPHALLIESGPGCGIELLTWHFVAKSLGLKGDGKEAIHPDLIWLEPEASGPRSEGQAKAAAPAKRSRGSGTQSNLAIRIEQIRECIEFVCMMPQAGAVRCAVVMQADRMTAQAANALLKTLEEPPSGGRLILATERPYKLTATVISRCQRIKIAPPSREAATDWLRAQCPEAEPELLDLYMREYGNAPYAIAEALEDGSDLIRVTLEDALRNAAAITTQSSGGGKKGESRGGFADLEIFGLLDRWQQLTHYLAMSQTYHEEIHHFYVQLVEAKKLFADIAGLNRRMHLERLLLQWRGLVQILKRSRRRIEARG